MRITMKTKKIFKKEETLKNGKLISKKRKETTNKKFLKLVFIKSLVVHKN